ncbi:MAG: autotransporter-associated beta strand repeat-containing protein [Verrucomicrobiae bacterium]|nr:autotransporter-associated beta strand repeat-containing protein [Verrucomicrobiae bacterium]
MNTNLDCPTAPRNQPPQRIRQFLQAMTAAASLTAALHVEAASQTWTNAPVSGSWSNVLNWVAKAAPGDINNSTANTVNSDIVTINSPITGGIGGAGNPIVPDDATVNGARSRRVCGIVFDTTNCGAYVIASPSPTLLYTADNPATGILFVCHNTGTNAQGLPLGSIRINDSVTNSQKVIVPLYVSLPSSTAGIYNLVNNSTNPGVTLTINSITHDGATSRGTVFVLDGTNTAPNVVTNLSEGPSAATGTGGGGITKQGPNTWIITGPGTFLGSSTINVINGLLIVRDPAAFGTALTTPINVSSLGTLQIDGVSLNQNAVTLGASGTVRMNGSGTLNGITVSNILSTTATNATTSATDVETLGNALNRVTGGAVSSVLHFTGPGTILMDYANNFAGRYSLDSGTNQLSDPGALGAAANYNLNAGAVLDVTPLTTGSGTYTFTPKAISANGTGTGVGTTASTVYLDPSGIFDFGSKAMNLTYAPAATNGDLTHPVIYAPQGNLNFNGNSITVVNASAQPLNAGTYTIVKQASGTATSSGAFVTIVTGSGLAPGMVGEIVAAGGSLNLLVYAYTPKSLVWTGTDPLLPATWDRQVSTNFLNGATPSVFNIYDSALFNATGIGQPVVTLAFTLVPGGVTVDTTAGNYTFAGSGQIAGGTSLVKVNAGTLFLNTVNTYSGGTVISNGVIQVGIDNAIPSTGLGDVTNASPAVLDLNGHQDTIGALDGNGTVDTTGGNATLSVGGNDNNGTFSGLLTNSTGTLNLTKVGLGTQVLTRSNTYAGTTDIELGVLKPLDPLGLGGGASALVINGGTLDLATNLIVPSLAGTGGSIANLSTTATNILTVLAPATTSYAGSIVSGAGKVGLRLLGGSLRMTGANTYTNGTFIGSGATFQIHNSPAAVAGPLIASNTATLGLSGGSTSPGTPATVTTVDGATVTFTSGAEGETWGGQFLGSASATNRFTSAVSIGGVASFSNFLGVVQIALASGNFRFFNGAGVSGGDNTTFEFDSGNVHTRDAQTVSLGSIRGGSSTCGISGNGTAGTVATWAIGAKNQNDFFEGYINLSNNLVKTGTGTLQLYGVAVVTNTDNATFTNYLFTPVINYLGYTTVSNGVLRVVAPNQLTNCTSITLAAVGTVLDASQMGYVSNQLSVDDNVTPTNSYVVTNGILVVPASTFAGIPQTLAGFGTVKGNGVISYGTINPGNATAGGTLSISNGLTIHAGATNYFDLSDDLTGLVKASDLINVQGNVTLAGASVVGIGALNGVVKAGKYTLIKYSGNLINESGIVPPGPVANLSLGGLFTATSRATMVLSNAPGELDLVVVSLNSKNLTWSGDGVSNLWDVVNSYTFTNNGAPIQFYQLDLVTFDDSATNYNALLAGTVVPSSLTVNTATNYSFGGSGNIGGTVTLFKTGTGSLLLTNGANSFTGGVVISNGLVSVGADSGGNQNDLGLGTGPVTVSTAGAELRFGGNGGSTVVNHFVTNAIILNGGMVKAQDGAQHLTNSTVTVAAGGGTLATVYSTKNLVLDSPLLGTGNVIISAVPAGTNVAAGAVVLNNPANLFSGTINIITNATLTLSGWAGVSNSPSINIQQGGILDVTGRTNAFTTLVAGQTLMGNGVLRGNLTAASGSTIAPGAAAATIGTLTANSAKTTITLGGTVVMDINRGATPNSDRFVSVTNIFGGTLTVNNLGTPPLLGDSFTLFTSVTNLGAFAVTNLPALSNGLGWSNSLVLNGKLTVIAVTTVNTNAFTLTNSVSGNVLTLSWPVDHIGYRLLVQTNSLANGLGTNWVTVPGSTNVSTASFTINPTNGTVFYRMIYP